MSAMAAQVYVADYARVFVLVLTMLVVTTLPSAIHPADRPSRAWLLIFAIEAIYASAMFAVIYHVGHRHVAWYRLPLIGLSDALALVYVGFSYRHKEVP